MSINQNQQILMSVVESKLDMAPQFGLGKAPETLCPVNAAR